MPKYILKTLVVKEGEEFERPKNYLKLTILPIMVEGETLDKKCLIAYLQEVE